MADEKKPTIYDDLYKSRMDAAESVRGLGRIMAPIGEEVAVNPAQRTSTYEDLYKAYYDTPISKDEEDRRKHAATQVNAVRHLGNAMNAFSNLIFTGGAAPSQTLPTIANPDLQAYSDKLRAARNQYGDAMIKGRLTDDADYRQQKAEEMQNRAYNDKVRQQNYENQMKPLEADAKAKQMEAEALREKAANDLNERQFAEQVKRAASADARGWASINNTKERNRISDERMKRQDEYRKTQLLAKQGIDPNSVVYDNANSIYKWKGISDETSLYNIYSGLERIGYKPSDKLEREHYSSMNNDKLRTKWYQAAIGEALRNDDSYELRDQLYRAGLIEPIYLEGSSGLNWGVTGETANNANNNTESEW